MTYAVGKTPLLKPPLDNAVEELIWGFLGKRGNIFTCGRKMNCCGQRAASARWCFPNTATTKCSIPCVLRTMFPPMVGGSVPSPLTTFTNIVSAPCDFQGLTTPYIPALRGWCLEPRHCAVRKPKLAHAERCYEKDKYRCLS